MTLKEFIEILLVDLDEKASDVMMIKKFKGFINRGYKEVAKREGLAKKITVVAENNSIPRPTDLMKIFTLTQNKQILEANLTNDEILVNIKGPAELIYNFNPENLVNDEDLTLTNAANDEFIVNYSKWLYCLSEGLEDQAPTYQREWANMRIKAPSIVTKITNVYDIKSNK